MAGWTKLYSSIVTSTIWREPDNVRLVWITMLAMADRKGAVEASVPGLADMARVTLADCVSALERLAEPDKWSRSQENEGRRIVAVDGGWLLLNHAKYRAVRDDEKRREYQREWLADKRAKARNSPAAVDNVDHGLPESTYAEAEADTNADPNTDADAAVGRAHAPVASAVPEPDATTAAAAIIAEVEAGTVDPLAAAILQTLRSDKRAVELGIADLGYAEQLLGVLAVAPYPLTAATAGEAICDALADLPAGANEQFARKMIRSYLKQQAKKPPGEHAHKAQDTDVAGALGIKSTRPSGKPYLAPYHRPFRGDK